MASQEEDEAAGEPESGSRDFLSRQGAMFAKGFSFSGFERDHVSLNRGDGTFLDISGVSGADSISDGRGAVFADLDNDGDTDVFLRAMHGPAQFLFRNNVGNEAGWLRVTLEGTDSGRDAFGAVVRVPTSRGIQTLSKSAGSGFLSESDPRLLFGLGTDPGVDWIEVAWPSGRTDRYPAARAGDSLRLVEGETAGHTVRETRFSLPDPITPEDRRWRQLAFERAAPLPSLTVRDTDGTAHDLAGLVAGNHRTLINFWATWCVPCRTEMPLLQKIHESADPNGLRIIGISTDRPEDRGQVPPFLRKMGVTYPVYIVDPADLSAIFAGSEIPIPTSLIIDADGHVIQAFTGWSREVQRHLLDLAAGAP
ncbi:MAG: redoxin domain-containing protein [Acidobacteriota bacterium]